MSSATKTQILWAESLCRKDYALGCCNSRLDFTYMPSVNPSDKAPPPFREKKFKKIMKTSTDLA